MKKIICYLVLMLLMACDSKEELEYAFIITKSTYMDDILSDSLSFYYDGGNRLVHVDECFNVIGCREHPVTYKANIIESLYGSYYLNDNNRIIKWEDNNLQVDYNYDGDNITYEKKEVENRVTDEHFYTYRDLSLAEDSGIYYDLNTGESHTTVYRYRYTDTIAPSYLIGFSGLFEYPSKHYFLIKEAESIERGILYRYTYEITENVLIEHKEFYDSFNEMSNEIMTTKYFFIK